MDFISNMFANCIFEDCCDVKDLLSFDILETRHVIKNSKNRNITVTLNVLNSVELR